MNYAINVKNRTIKVTTNAADGVNTFGHFQVAKASLIAELEDSMAQTKQDISAVRSIREKDLKQNGNGHAQGPAGGASFHQPAGA